MKQIRAPFLTLNEIRNKADKFRDDYFSNQSLPLDIIAIAEFKLNIEFIPIPELKEIADIDAVILPCFTKIAVDSGLYMDERYINRLRFSIAHEVGHSVLHRDFWNKLNCTDSSKGFIEVFSQIPEQQYSWIERHADEFAGRLLVPPDLLLEEVVRNIDNIPEEEKDFYSKEEILESISPAICRTFGVSDQVIDIRINREKIIEKIK